MIGRKDNMNILPMYPPPRGQPSVHERQEPQGGYREEVLLHSSLQKNTKYLNILRHSANKTTKEGNFDTSPNSKLTKTEEEGSLRDRNINDRPELSRADSSQTTVRAHHGHQLRAESESRQNDSQSLRGYLEEGERRESRAASSREAIQQNATEKTITIPNQPQRHHNLNNIIDSFDTVRHIEDERQKPVRKEVEAIKIVENICSAEHLPHKMEVLCLNDSSGCLDNSEQNVLIWRQDEYELNEMNIKEREIQSNCQDSHQDIVIELELTQASPQIKQPELEQEQIFSLNQQLITAKQELSTIKEKNRVLEEKNLQFQMLKLFNTERYQEMQEENKELNDLLLQHKQLAYHNDVTIKNLKAQIDQLTSALSSSKDILQQKDEEIAELVAIFRQKDQEYQELTLVSQELEEILKEKVRDFDQQTARLNRDIDCLKQTVTFYKDRLEQQGFTFNLDQIKHIKELFECQIENERKITQTIQKQYQQSINHLLREKEVYSREIVLLKDKKDKTAIGRVLHSQTQQIMEEYDHELQLRDEQIIALRHRVKEAQQLYSQINVHNCNLYLKHLDGLSTILLSNNLHEHRSAELIIQFVYILNKLCKILQVSMLKINGMEEEIVKLRKLMDEKDSLYNQEVEGLAWDLVQIEKQRDSLTVKFQEVKMKYYALAYQQKDSIIEVDQGLRHPSLASSMILSRMKNEADSPINFFQQASSFSLKQQSRKENTLTLEQILTQKTIKNEQKNNFALRFIQFTQEILRQNRKPVSIKPNEIMISKVDGCHHFQMMKNTSKRSKESEYALFYAAPEVLLGFSESEQSYVWTVGLVLDQLFHNSFFYKKINLITSRQENYRCRNQDLQVREMLELMLKKKQKERCCLQKCKQLLEGVIVEGQ